MPNVQFCLHCGRVYIVDGKTEREDCDCGAELYPVTKAVVLGEELRGADGHQIRVAGVPDGRRDL